MSAYLANWLGPSTEKKIEFIQSLGKRIDKINNDRKKITKKQSGVRYRIFQFVLCTKYPTINENIKKIPKFKIDMISSW